MLEDGLLGEGGGRAEGSAPSKNGLERTMGGIGVGQGKGVSDWGRSGEETDNLVLCIRFEVSDLTFATCTVAVTAW